jgi:hypothetical protein
MTVTLSSLGAVNQKVQEFLSTGTFTVPSNCTSVEIFMVGGGGGGGWAQSAASNGSGPCGAGGGGGQVIQRKLNVTAGQAYTVTIGGAGTGATSFANAGNGGDSSFGSLVTALGGAGGGSIDTNSNQTRPSSSKGCGGGLAASTGGGYNGAGGGGGGAGGNAITFSYAGNGIPYIHWAGGVGSVSYGGNGAFGNYNFCSSISGPGIDGYGIGGTGGASGAAFQNATGYLAEAGLLPGAVVTSAGGAQTPSNAAANTGYGGGGGATWSNGTLQTANGASGGSGYARVTYWS